MWTKLNLSLVGCFFCMLSSLAWGDTQSDLREIERELRDAVGAIERNRQEIERLRAEKADLPTLEEKLRQSVDAHLEVAKDAIEEIPDAFKATARGDQKDVAETA